MELLLINHPLDCPVCDKGGECPLQNQAMSNGRGDSRFDDVKRTFPKPITISSQVLLDRERCVLCARCTRFSDQIAGDPFIELLERGALQQVGIAPDEPFDSYFSGNTVQICPVGALTGTAYRFRARPFDLVSSPSVCEHCASGCAQRTDHRRGKVLRRLAGDDPEVNEEWNCDKGRWAFTYATQRRPAHHSAGPRRGRQAAAASWSDALDVAARGWRPRRHAPACSSAAGSQSRTPTPTPSSRGWCWAPTTSTSAPGRTQPRRPTSWPRDVAGPPMTVTYADLETAPAVLLAGFEPEEESPIVFLRLRKAARKHGVQVLSVAPFATRGLAKMSGRLIRTAPGGEAAALDELHRASCCQPGAVILVGERLATSPVRSPPPRLAAATGARLAWIPRRAGERGALEAGALPNLLPGGRPVADARRANRSRRRGISPTCPTPSAATPQHPGRGGRRELGALLIGGVEPADLPDPDAALAAIEAVPVRRQPGAARKRRHRTRRRGLPRRAGGREGRHIRQLGGPASAVRGGAAHQRRARPAGAATRSPTKSAWTSACRPPRRPVRSWPGSAGGAAPGRSARGSGGSPGRSRDPVRRCWPAGGCCSTPVVCRTASPSGRHRPRARRTALGGHRRRIGVAEGESVTVATKRGEITLPLEITDMPDRVVWLPMNSPGSAVHQQLGVTAGAVVRSGGRN